MAEPTDDWGNSVMTQDINEAFYNCIRFYWIICQNIDRFREAILNSDDFPPGFRPQACGGGGVLTWIIFFWDRENPRSIFDNCAIWFKYLFSFPEGGTEPPLWSAPMDPFPNPHRARDTPYLWIALVTNIKAKYKKMQQRTFLFVSSLDINTKIHVRWISQQHTRFNHATKKNLLKLN